MYGCKFSPNDPAIRFVGLWSSNDLKIGDDIRESFSVKKHFLLQTNCARELIEFEEDEVEMDYTPIILSSRFSKAITLPKIEDIKSPTSINTDISSNSETDMLYHLLPMLSKERLQNPMYKWQIGRCIYNISKKESSTSQSTYKDLFNTYCSDDKEQNEVFWKQYGMNSGVNDFLSIRTIGFFARIDNPDAYDEWHTAWMEESVKQSLDKIELNVAEVMYRLLWLDFLTVGKNDWYRFNPAGNKLIKSIANVDFTLRFPEMIQFYARVLKDTAIQMHESAAALSNPSEKKSESTERTKAISEITRKLGTRAYQRAIESHCFSKFYRDRVDQFFDTNPCLTAWSNCITEVQGDNIYSRRGKMEDFITMNSDIEYNESDYTWDHPDIKELLYWFKTCFVDDDLIDCYLKMCSSFLIGINKEKKFYALCGPSGNNSKTMTGKLLQKSIICICS